MLPEFSNDEGDMSTSTQPTLKDSLNDIIELRPFPAAAASQLLIACEKKDVAAREITSIIKHDPGCQ